MSDDTFYSDRVGLARPRTNEEVTAEAWAGLTSLIRQRINDASFARVFPKYDCPGDPTGRSTITGSDEEMFFDALRGHIPQLFEPPEDPDTEQGMGSMQYLDFDTSGPASSVVTANPLDPRRVPDTVTSLDLVDFVALYIDQPTGSTSHNWDFPHTHYSFNTYSDPLANTELTPGRARFRKDIDRLFARNGIAFTLGDDLRVRRLGPPEGRSLISAFTPRTGDQQLDGKLDDAMARFLSRNSADRRDALEKLWDAFERLKTLELGGGTLKKSSASQLITRAASGSESFRELLDTEFKALSTIGNKFTIRHHEHDQEELPTDAAIDYLFLRLSSVIALVLRSTGRMSS
ncbi:hypothetical protein Psi02_15400 [Planotetraspora silvatica]|uniref:Uncharacterized protein n=1 Tax=Planotetraspora silvatica TaxID=234614 RepID=A0A8J3UIJ6_9ACTN|nr:hypothetical protein [Planotetraspora silvatica]GII45116.1 hypothetical protein Psi02_15400 [Planotetraspora silvatica]